jgi:N-formylglutamate amidohydrolase
MKFLPITLLACSALLVGCTSGYDRPHSYCHKLTTRINSYDHASNQSRVNAAQRARWAQEYQNLDCDGQ